MLYFKESQFVAELDLVQLASTNILLPYSIERDREIIPVEHAIAVIIQASVQLPVRMTNKRTYPTTIGFDSIMFPFRSCS